MVNVSWQTGKQWPSYK